MECLKQWGLRSGFGSCPDEKAVKAHYDDLTLTVISSGRQQILVLPASIRVHL